MLASLLIKQLQELIELYGDREMRYVAEQNLYGLANADEVILMKPRYEGDVESFVVV